MSDPSRITTRILKGTNAFLSLESAWNALASVCQEQNPYRSFAWNQHWLSHFGSAHPPVICVAYRGTRVTGMLPLVRVNNAWLLMGGLHQDQSCILASDEESMAALITAVLKELPGTHAFLRFLHSHSAELLSRVLVAKQIPFIQIPTKEYVVDTSQFSPMTMHRAQNLVQKERRLAKLGSVDLREATNGREWAEALAFLFHHGSERLARNQSATRLADPANQRFLSDCAMHDPPFIKFYTFTLDQTILSVIAGCDEGTNFHVVATTFDPQWKRYSPGILGFRRLLASPSVSPRVFFGAGEQEYKKYFTNRTIPRAHIVVFWNPLFAHLYHIKHWLSDSIQKIRHPAWSDNAARLGITVAKHTAIQTIGRVLSLLIALLTFPVLTRYFGPEQYGYLATATSFLYIFNMLSGLGVFDMVSRELPLSSDKNRFFGEVVGFKLILSLAGGLLAMGTVWLTSAPSIVKIAVTIGAFAFSFQSFIALFAAFFQVRLDTKYLAIGDVTNKLMIGVMALLTWFFSLSLGFFMVGYVLGIGFNMLYLWTKARQQLPFRIQFNARSWPRLWKLSWPFFTINIITFIYFRADTLLLSVFKTPFDVGIYGAAYKLLEVFISFPGLFTNLMTPLFTRMIAKKETERFTSVFQQSIHALSLVVFPMIFFTVSTAPFIIVFTAGEEFRAAAPILRILIVATGVIFFANLASAGVAAVNQQKAMVRYSAAAAIGACILYLILIPRFSYFGAAFATLAVETFVLAAMLKLVGQKIPLILPVSHGFRVMCSAAIASIPLVFMPIHSFGVFIVSGIVYLILFAICALTFRVVDRAFIKKIFFSGSASHSYESFS